MICREIIDVIERTYPKEAAMEWDNVGFLAGRMEKETEKVFVALDATDEVIDEVIGAGADLLVTHHPLIFSPMKAITDASFIGARIVKLLQHDLSCYAAHTNYDVFGMAELAGRMLGLCDAAPLQETDPVRKAGIGRVGNWEKEMTVGACCRFVKTVFGLPAVRLYGREEETVRRVAVLPGSGRHMTELALEKGAQVLITGDIDHHEGIDAAARGLAVIDAGHYGLESVFIEDMAAYLERNLPTLTVMRAKIAHPFQTL